MNFSRKKTKDLRSLRTENYGYIVIRSEEDKTYIGKVLEFPSLAAHDDTQERALTEVRGVVGSVLEELSDSGEPSSTPFGHRHHSGKLNVRMSAELHRRLVVESEQQGISLNALINLKLAK